MYQTVNLIQQGDAGYEKHIDHLFEMTRWVDQVFVFDRNRTLSEQTV